MAANTKTSWLDEGANTSLISEKAQRLDSFLKAVEDGKVTDAEVKSQEERLVKLMKEIEPQLEPKLHDRVTELLCELTAYDLMQALNMMQAVRPMSKVRG
jgi:polyhydroxyalkanoate synthesis regulator phasin